MNKVSLSISLPPEIQSNVNVQQALESLGAELISAAQVAEVQGQLRIEIHGNLQPPIHVHHTPTTAIRGGSPSDWYHNEDQMTHGGKPNGRIWDNDNRVL